MRTPQVSQPLKAIAAGIVCIVVLVTMMILHAWPLWTGQVVTMPVTLSISHDLVRGEGVAVAHAGRRIVVGDPSTVRPPADVVVLPPRGEWWGRLMEDRRGLGRKMAGRVVYVQLEPDGSARYQPLSISDAPVSGAVNLKGRVRRVTGGDVLDVAYGLESFWMEEGVARQIMSDVQRPGVRAAEVRVAISRSGRARIKTLVIDGKEM